MANGAPISEEHDRVLRGVLSSTGKPLAHWFKKLDEAGVQRRSFLAALDFLREKLGVPHQAASAIAWTFFNPSMVPDEMVKAARAASDVVEKFTEDPLARRAVAAADGEAEPELSATGPSRPKAASRPPAGKPAAAKPTRRAAPKPAPKAAARKPAKPAPKATARAARKPTRKTARKR